MGGGLKIRYSAKVNPLSSGIRYAVWPGGTEAAFWFFCRLILEPGVRYGRCRHYPYTIGNIKTIPGVRKYVMVDGGMADNPRVALYQAMKRSSPARQEPATETVTVAGKCCESGDILIWDIPLAAPGKDILAVSTGATPIPWPATITGCAARCGPCCRRPGGSDCGQETYKLLANDLYPARLVRGKMTMIMLMIKIIYRRSTGEIYRVFSSLILAAPRILLPW